MTADSGCGVLDQDLGRAMAEAMAIPRERCRAYAGRFSWQRCVEQFIGNLHPVDGDRSTVAEPLVSA